MLSKLRYLLLTRKVRYGDLLCVQTKSIVTGGRKVSKLVPKSTELMIFRSFKKFGHKEVGLSNFSLIWQAFLTFNMVGAAIDYKGLKEFYFGKKDLFLEEDDPYD